MPMLYNMMVLLGGDSCHTNNQYSMKPWQEERFDSIVATTALERWIEWRKRHTGALLELVCTTELKAKCHPNYMADMASHQF